MATTPDKPVQFDETAFPEGLPSDPRISYNPSRVSFADLGVLDEPVSTVADFPAAEALRHSGCEPTEEVVRGYELRRIIGRGGFGEVWEGVQHSLHRVIAIKRVRDDIYDKAREHSRSSAFCEVGFRHEALTTGALDHPNIVPVYDFGEDENGRPILAMKLVRGKPWDQIMWDDYNDPTQDFLNKHLQIFISVAQAVAFAHSRGVVHRDIKPAQVMVGEFGEVVLMDWGLALVYDRDLTKVQETPLNSGIVPTCDSAPNPAGTLAFMAPEQTECDASNIGPHTDVYLLGGTLYFLLTRSPPHSAPDSKAAFIEAKSGLVDPPNVRASGREIPEELESLCMRALEPDLSRRIQSVKELIDGVKAYLTGAGKRRESEALVEEAREIIEARRCNYRELARGLSAIERAAGLWPDNPDIDDIREQLHVRYSRLALQNRDLVLASAQVERISRTDLRKQLTKEIGKRRLYLASLRWAVRVFMMGTLLLLIVVSFMAQGLNRRAAEAHRLREAAESGEHAAVASRRNAEELVNFLVDDLHKSLTRLGRLDLIDRVANEANQYYANLPATGSSDERGEALRRARALRVLGDVQAQDRTRSLGEPLEVYREALRLSEDLAARDPDRVDVMASLASSRFRVGSLRIWTGDPEDGLHDLQASEKLHKEVYTLDPTRTDALLEATVSIMMRAQVLGYMGQPEFAESLMRDARGLMQTLEGFESTRPEARRLRAGAAIHRADEVARLGLMEDAEQLLAAGRRDLDLLASDNTFDLHRRMELAQVESIEAFIEMHRGSLASAREKNLAAIAEMEQIVEFSPHNSEWHRHLAESYIYQAYIEIGLAGDLDAGVEWVSRAVVISKGSAFQDPTNLLNQTWLAMTHGIVGTLMQEYGRKQLAIDELDMAIRILKELEEKAPTVSFWSMRRRQFTIVRARAMAQSGDVEDAIARMTALEAEMLQSDRIDRPDEQLILASARLLRGECMIQTGRVEQAREALSQAAEGAARLIADQTPNRYHAMRTQAAALIHLGERNEAAPIIKQLEERGFVGRELGKLLK